MKSEETVKKMLSDLELLQSQGRKNPFRCVQIKQLKWVLDIVPSGDEVQPEVKEEMAVAQ